MWAGMGVARQLCWCAACSSCVLGYDIPPAATLPTIPLAGNSVYLANTPNSRPLSVVDRVPIKQGEALKHSPCWTV